MTVTSSGINISVDIIKLSMLRSPWTLWTLNPKTTVLIKDRREDNEESEQEETRTGEVRGRDWRDAARNTWSH
jgi:hypothetical protein